MNVWTRIPAATAPGGWPTPLLRHLAGEFAPRIAGLWPAPHTPFMGATADRRHLLCLALARTPGQLDAVVADELLTRPMKVAVSIATPDAPVGLARALGRLGEVAWKPEEYARLLDALTTERVAGALRHSEVISPEWVDVLASIPPRLREAGIGARLLTRAQAGLLTEAYAALSARDGDASAFREALRWGAHATVNEALMAASESLLAEPPAPPFPGSERIRALTSKKEMNDAARRFRNCLSSCIINAADGTHAYYERIGEPGVAIEVFDDPLFGWRLNQARIASNREVPEAVRLEIIAELQSWGVHVGRSYWDLSNALDDAREETYALDPVETTVKSVFGA